MIDSQVENYFMENSEQFPDTLYLAIVDDARVEKVQCRVEGTLFKSPGAERYQSLAWPYPAFFLQEDADVFLHKELVLKVDDLALQHKTLSKKLSDYEQTLGEMALAANQEARESNS